MWWNSSSQKRSLIQNKLNSLLQKKKDDTETTLLIRQVKELFSKNIKNSKDLSKIIDKYLIPQENEKKQNAESLLITLCHNKKLKKKMKIIIYL